MENKEECKLNQTTQNRGVETEQEANMTVLVRETRRWGKKQKDREENKDDLFITNNMVPHYSARVSQN